MPYLMIHADVGREALIFKVSFQIGRGLAAILIVLYVGKFYAFQNFNKVGEVFVALRRDLIRLWHIRFQHGYAVEWEFIHRKQRC